MSQQPGGPAPRQCRLFTPQRPGTTTEMFQELAREALAGKAVEIEVDGVAFLFTPKGPATTPPMSAARFDELVNGPLGHPFPMFRLTRLAISLRWVVDATGDAGVRALEDHCHRRAQADHDEREGE